MTGERYDVSKLFDMSEVEEDVFETQHAHVPGHRLYGGQLVSQALAAVMRTVPADRKVHSCHAYFVRPGRAEMTLQYRVSRDRDGQSFSMRRVEGWQNGEMLIAMSASFHVDEDGPTHQFAMPTVPPPENLPSTNMVLAPVVSSFPEAVRSFWENDIGIEYRPVEPFVPLGCEPRPARRSFWMRASSPLGIAADSPLHSAMLAYASDMHILDTGLLPLGYGCAEPTLGDASLDHAIWFHAPLRADDWLLYAMDSPVASHSRFLARGQVFRRDGQLVASVTQEGLIRIPPQEFERLASATPLAAF